MPEYAKKIVSSKLDSTINWVVLDVWIGSFEF